MPPRGDVVAPRVAPTLGRGSDGVKDKPANGAPMPDLTSARGTCNLRER